MKNGPDFIALLLMRLDGFLCKMEKVDPEKLQTQMRYRIFIFLLPYINNFLYGLRGIDVNEVRRRIRWQRKAGIPFDPKNFSTSKLPFRK